MTHCKNLGKNIVYAEILLKGNPRQCTEENKKKGHLKSNRMYCHNQQKQTKCELQVANKRLKPFARRYKTDKRYNSWLKMGKRNPDTHISSKMFIILKTGKFQFLCISGKVGHFPYRWIIATKKCWSTEEFWEYYGQNMWSTRKV